MCQCLCTGQLLSEALLTGWHDAVQIDELIEGVLDAVQCAHQH